MSWVGLALIIVAVIAFVLLKTEHGVSRLGNRRSDKYRGRRHSQSNCRGSCNDSRGVRERLII